MLRRTNQKFQRYDLVKVASYYPWIRRGGEVVAHHTGHGEEAIICGSYADQYGGGKRERMIYTLLFEKHGEISWYDEDYLSLIQENRPDLFEQWKMSA